jgi:hypothetical protein
MAVGLLPPGGREEAEEDGMQYADVAEGSKPLLGSGIPGQVHWR